MLDRMGTMDAFFREGGVLFVFPEGTRSRGTGLAPLNPGAFKIARMCRVPVAVLTLRGTDRIFTPGRFRFHTGISETVTVDLAGTLDSGPGGERASARDLMDRARHLLEQEERP